MNETSANPKPPRRANFWSTVSLFLVCATIAYIVHQYTQLRPAAREGRRLWTPIVVTSENKENVLQAGTRRLEFWTPSSKTKEYLTHEGASLRERDKWESIAGEEPVQQFGAMLHTNLDVLGYRRAEVWGHGRTTFKPGWWWSITVTTNYSVQQLAQAYRGFWKSTNTIFVERIENPGEE